MEKIKVNKDIFFKIINLKNYSVVKLGKAGICNEKTIRRSLNAGKMSTKFFNPIAELINVDPKFLSGEIVYSLVRLRNVSYDDLSENEKNKFLSIYLDKFTYFRKVKEDSIKLDNDEIFTSILSVFDVDYKKQIQSLNFDTYIEFLKDFYYEIGDVIKKYVQVDAYGKDFTVEFYKIINDIENFQENHYIEQYVEEELRPGLLENLPGGYSYMQIKNMPAFDLWELHLFDLNKGF